MGIVSRKTLYQLQQAGQQQAVQVESQQQPSQEASPVINGLQQSVGSTSGVVIGQEVLGWISWILILTILGCCIYTCSKAHRGELLFFYNWLDAILSLSFTIVLLIGMGASKKYMIIIGIIGVLVYNAYRAYGFYKKDIQKMILVGLSRIIVSLLLPPAYLCILFLAGAKKGDSSWQQMKTDVEKAALLTALSYLLFRLVNGHIVQELHVESEKYNSDHTSATQEPKRANTV